MKRSPGHDAGHALLEPRSSLDWGAYVAWLVSTHGSLARVAVSLSQQRGFRDEAESVERALRRLRTRGHDDGGVWGARALACFGLPEAFNARARWMGMYHSRFVDLPVPVCEDLLRAWQRPPTSEAPSVHTWLALGWATCALRSRDAEGAQVYLQRARAQLASAPREARVELLLTEAFVASADAPSRITALLDRAEQALETLAPSDDATCLRARLVDQRTFALQRDNPGRAEVYARAAAMHRALLDDGPPFAQSRRHNGLAFSLWKLGQHDEAAAHARAAVDRAGDGGHLRARAMGLQLLARIVGRESPEGAEAHARALAIARALDDEALRMRFERRAHSAATQPRAKV